MQKPGAAPQVARPKINQALKERNKLSKERLQQFGLCRAFSAWLFLLKSSWGVAALCPRLLHIAPLALT
jgi:hypothetical protein